MGRFATLAALCICLVATPAMAECGKPDPSDGVSQEAMSIISRRYLMQIEANERINREVTQKLLGRMFDLKTGKQLELSPGLLEQYRRDARYFADLLRKEAVEQSARADVVFAKLNQPCRTSQPK